MDNEEVSSDGVEVTLSINRRGDIYTLAFRCEGSLTVACDRCLDPLTIPVDADYTMTLKYGEAYSDDGEDTIILPQKQATFNVADAIYSTLMLALPLQRVHLPGECNPEMEQFLCSEDSFDREEYTEEETL